MGLVRAIAHALGVPPPSRGCFQCAMPCPSRSRRQLADGQFSGGIRFSTSSERPHDGRRRQAHGDKPYDENLFLHPPQSTGSTVVPARATKAKREIRSFWYPTWLAQPAALVPDGKS